MDTWQENIHTQIKLSSSGNQMMYNWSYFKIFLHMDIFLLMGCHLYTQNQKNLVSTISQNNKNFASYKSCCHCKEKMWTLKNQSATTLLTPMGTSTLTSIHRLPVLDWVTTILLCFRQLILMSSNECWPRASDWASLHPWSTESTFNALFLMWRQRAWLE